MLGPIIWGALMGGISLIVFFGYSHMFGFSFVNTSASAVSENMNGCLISKGPHVAILILDSDCMWAVTDLSNQGYVVTNAVANANAYGTENQNTGFIFMQKNVSYLFSSSSLVCHSFTAGKLVESTCP